jgi:NDP-sugar pyrophosphorylase family protein
MVIPRTEELFDLTHTIAEGYLKAIEEPQRILPEIKDICLELIPRLGDNFYELYPGVWVARDAKIADSATIMGPTIIGSKTEVRPSSYIRGSAIIGEGAVIGNSTEIKNAIIFDGAQLPHYNYVGDSIIGYKAHLGAGAIISNFRLDHGQITIKTDDGKIKTGLRKMGVLLGDRAEVGCNSVICPGSIIGRDSVIYPLSRFNGILPKEYYFYGSDKAPRKGNK